MADRSVQEVPAVRFDESDAPTVPLRLPDAISIPRNRVTGTDDSEDTTVLPVVPAYSEAVKDPSPGWVAAVFGVLVLLTVASVTAGLYLVPLPGAPRVRAVVNPPTPTPTPAPV